VPKNDYTSRDFFYRFLFLNSNWFLRSLLLIWLFFTRCVYADYCKICVIEAIYLSVIFWVQ